MKIPEDEQNNVLSIFYSIVQQMEYQTSEVIPKYDRLLVNRAYDVFNRIGFTTKRPRWELKCKKGK